MQLEVSIEALLNKERVESNRIEFKEGWNPDDIQEELKKNGSPVAVFETDNDTKSVCVTIPIHPRFLKTDETEIKKVPKKRLIKQ